MVDLSAVSEVVKSQGTVHVVLNGKKIPWPNVSLDNAVERIEEAKQARINQAFQDNKDDIAECVADKLYTRINSVLGFDKPRTEAPLSLKRKGR